MFKYLYLTLGSNYYCTFSVHILSLLEQRLIESVSAAQSSDGWTARLCWDSVIGKEKRSHNYILIRVMTYFLTSAYIN